MRSFMVVEPRILLVDDDPKILETHARLLKEYYRVETAPVRLVVYDLLGREVARLFDGPQEVGYHQAIWNGRTATGRLAPSGIYLARLVTPPTVGPAPESARSLKACPESGEGCCCSSETGYSMLDGIPPVAGLALSVHLSLSKACRRDQHRLCRSVASRIASLSG